MNSKDRLDILVSFLGKTKKLTRAISKFFETKNKIKDYVEALESLNKVLDEKLTIIERMIVIYKQVGYSDRQIQLILTPTLEIILNQLAKETLCLAEVEKIRASKSVF